ncbi:hypothetical protein BGW80DRAFT_1249823 [Lactifluus volemus]|nr:hypothetical protein BGW80DRAFT_1249823 [Lactifluus volemus]
MVRKQVRAKVSVFEVHKPETHRIPAITIHHNKGRLGQRSDSVKSTRESRTTSQPIRDENVTGLEAAVAEDVHDFELPASVDTKDDPPTKNSETPMGQWISYRQEFLDELLRHEAQPLVTQCFKCTSLSATFKCRDCFCTPLWCKECLLQEHAIRPFHRIMAWNGAFYGDVSLQELGLVLQLGHGGGKCSSPCEVIDDFVVIDISGIHIVNIKFCACLTIVGNSRHHTQLLRACLLPVTMTRPRTAFTFECLDSFHLLTLQGKTTAYDFYHTMIRKSGKIGLFNAPVWSMLSWLGVTCKFIMIWLYSLNLTIDANFQLKLKNRGITNDPLLGDGWGHWVPNGPYEEYIGTYGWQEEPNLCDSELHAVNHTNKKFMKGYKATGAGVVLLVSESQGSHPPTPFHHATTKSRDRLDQIRDTKDAHLWPREIMSNQYSARTDGEDPERWWAHINPVTTSTREMGPGSRQDTIDDHAAAWNFCKIIGFGSSLLSQLQNAIKMRAKHKALFVKFSERFSQVQITQWMRVIELWEEDPRSTNPYDEPDALTSLKEVMLELAKEDLDSAIEGDRPISDVSANVFLKMALELEEQQRILKFQISKIKNIEASAETLEKHRVLVTRIQTLRKIQAVYMPFVSTSSFDLPNTLPISEPETFDLCLPSSPSISVSVLHAIPDLVEKEKHMRLAQMHDALVNLRRLLRITMGLWQYKYKHIGPSQRVNTQARSCISRFQDKLDSNGPWVTMFRELKKEDVMFPGKGNDEGEGFRVISWIWLENGKTGAVDLEAGQEEINEYLRVEWAKSRARAERWAEEVRLTAEEMQRVLWYFDWKSHWWAAQGLVAYARKQARVQQQMAEDFAKHWLPYHKANSLTRGRSS